ncbi:hypothetical protein [Burkholderia cepacia]|uniref:hypothetical protein n=1 Tax=Burkholderia cepacia TaxID=292 RepID=UPI001F37B174|nr:hypothetical protein [Burkholderia cepacia]UIY58161.1 hypothetical protein LZ568_08080 [Burkholderia cepacia]
MKITDDMLTEWFPHEMKPVHVGVYETDFNVCRSGGWAYWDGKNWGNSCRRPSEANNRRYPSAIQNKGWRGLKEKHYG